MAQKLWKLLKQALDEVWVCIAFTIVPDLVENTRLMLAHAIVAHAGLGDQRLRDT
jgi:hypothetical protein